MSYSAPVNTTATELSTSAADDLQRIQSLKWAMFLAGSSVFALLYAVQPMMPLLSAEFGLSAADASWVLSISTLTLALSLLLSSLLSEFIDRRRLMIVAVASTAILSLLCALAQNYTQLLWLRALLGLALGGMPALAITYLSSEVPAARLSQTIGFYIAGTALGGMLGRAFGALLSDHYSWRLALLCLGLAGLAAAWQFQRMLPNPKPKTLPNTSPHTSPRGTKFTPATPDLQSLRQMMRSVFMQIRQPKLLALFAIAFLLTGSYTGLYNYITFYLLAPPYLFSQSTVAAITVFYIFGIGSSLWGAMLTKHLPLRTLVPMALTLMLGGLCATLHPDVRMILAGIALFTFGFFATHTLCSNWLATLVQAPTALVTAVYLCCYYLGASTLGAFSGIGWDSGGWPALVQLLALLLCLALALSLWLAWQSLPQSPQPQQQRLPAAPQHESDAAGQSAHRATDEAYWQQHSLLYPRDQAFIQLENGYVGMQPSSVLQAWQQHQQQINSQSAFYLRQQWPQEEVAIYQQLAEFCGVLPEELLLTRNLGEGMHILLHGYPLQPGDEVICATQDYDTVLASLQWLATAKQVQIRPLQLPVNGTDQALVQCYADAITPRSKLIVLSHLCHRHGQILPVAQISRMARRYGVDVLVDAAHSFAQLDYQLPALDADFIATNLHKWFGAPLGTGLLFIRQSRLAQIRPLYGLAHNAPMPIPTSTSPSRPIQRLAALGTVAVPALLNIRDALTFQRAIGPAQKEQRLRYLSQYWLDQARQISNLQVITPADPAQSCAITAFTLGEHRADDVVAALWQQARIFTVSRQLNQLQIVRITVQLFTQPGELDQLIVALRQIATKAGTNQPPFKQQQSVSQPDHVKR
ncbi:MFS transporter [Rheinheimera sp.]|uniref:MFS transporter n=1 Tax=Rheinheimera sp. TaxID=1869214 RepID=UPI003D2BB55E